MLSLSINISARNPSQAIRLRNDHKLSSILRFCRRARAATFIGPHRSKVLSANPESNLFWVYADNNGTPSVLVPHQDGIPSAQTGWHPLVDPLTWKVLEEDAIFQTPLPEEVAPTWKMMLLSDGSVTRHLQLLTGHHIEVECLEMRDIGKDLVGLPEGSHQIMGPRVQRQVFLRLPGEKEGQHAHKGKALVYAASWWNARAVNEYLRDTKLPIWASLSKERTELYRDVQALYYGSSPFLAREFGEPGPFWGRQYVFWHNNEPLTLIYEVFSTALQRCLGPSMLPL